MTMTRKRWFISTVTSTALAGIYLALTTFLTPESASGWTTGLFLLCLTVLTASFAGVFEAVIFVVLTALSSFLCYTVAGPENVSSVPYLIVAFTTLAYLHVYAKSWRDSVLAWPLYSLFAMGALFSVWLGLLYLIVGFTVQAIVLLWSEWNKKPDTHESKPSS